MLYCPNCGSDFAFEGRSSHPEWHKCVTCKHAWIDLKEKKQKTTKIIIEVNEFEDGDSTVEIYEEGKNKYGGLVLPCGIPVEQAAIHLIRQYFIKT